MNLIKNYLAISFLILIIGCDSTGQPIKNKIDEKKENEIKIILTQGQKEMHVRVIQLLNEAKVNTNLPLVSVEFDNKRDQWGFHFDGGKPDYGFSAYINNKDSIEIDIHLLPSMWTKYKRK